MSHFDASYARVLLANAAIAKLEAGDPDFEVDAAMCAALDEREEAEWQLIRSRAQGFADIKRRATWVRQMVKDAPDAGPFDRQRAAVAVLVSEILGYQAWPDAL
jgi:hypothetical protein